MGMATSGLEDSIGFSPKYGAEQQHQRNTGDSAIMVLGEVLESESQTTAAATAFSNVTSLIS